jgi:hypothetical protein
MDCDCDDDHGEAAAMAVIDLIGTQHDADSPGTMARDVQHSWSGKSSVDVGLVDAAQAAETIHLQTVDQIVPKSTTQGHCSEGFMKVDNMHDWQHACLASQFVLVLFSLWNMCVGKY